MCAHRAHLHPILKFRHLTPSNSLNPSPRGSLQLSTANRVWAPLVRVAKQFPPRRLARIQEVHTASGRHVTQELPFPQWVPDEISAEASRLSENEAFRRLGAWWDRV